MSYRMGRGDLSRGGFFGSLVHGIGGALSGAIGGLIKTKNPLGAIGGAVIGAGTSVYRYNQPSASESLAITTPVRADQTPEELVRAHQVNVHRAQTAVTAGGATPALMAGSNGYGGYRRMNYGNIKALRRALRRANGFKDLALKTIRLIDPRRKAKSFGGWKRRGRRK